jgi:hypothetical protein
MLTIRAMVAAAVFAGTIIAAAPAVASCDSIYTGTCTPIPAKDPPEPAAEPEKVSKPLRINARRLASRKARAERSAQKERKRYARSVTTTRVFALRQRRAKAIAAVPRERIKPAAIEDVEPSPPVRSAKAPRRVTAADPGATSGEAPDVNAATDILRPQPVVTVPVSSSVASPVANPVEQARPAPAASPAPIPLRTVAQNEVNEIDLAAAAATPDPADQSWMRTLVLAFGGLLAVGSALRLFL